MPPEYAKGEYEKLKAELRAEYKEDLFKLKKQIQEQRAREEEREKQEEKLIAEKEKMLSRLWMERVVYIGIIIGAVSILVTIIVT